MFLMVQHRGKATQVWIVNMTEKKIGSNCQNNEMFRKLDDAQS